MESRALITSSSPHLVISPRNVKWRKSSDCDKKIHQLSNEGGKEMRKYPHECQQSTVLYLPHMHPKPLHIQRLIPFMLHIRLFEQQMFKKHLWNNLCHDMWSLCQVLRVCGHFGQNLPMHLSFLSQNILDCSHAYPKCSFLKK